MYKALLNIFIIKNPSLVGTIIKEFYTILSKKLATFYLIKLLVLH